MEGGGRRALEGNVGVLDKGKERYASGRSPATDLWWSISLLRRFFDVRNVRVNPRPPVRQFVHTIPQLHLRTFNSSKINFNQPDSLSSPPSTPSHGAFENALNEAVSTSISSMTPLFLQLSSLVMLGAPSFQVFHTCPPLLFFIQKRKG